MSEAIPGEPDYGVECMSGINDKHGLTLCS